MHEVLLHLEAPVTTEVATEYLRYLYSEEGQRIAAANFYRPVVPEFADPADLARFQEIELVTIDHFNGWAEAQPRFFADGAIFDQIYAAP